MINRITAFSFSIPPLISLVTTFLGLMKGSVPLAGTSAILLALFVSSFLTNKGWLFLFSSVITSCIVIFYIAYSSYDLDLLFTAVALLLTLNAANASLVRLTPTFRSGHDAGYPAAKNLVLREVYLYSVVLLLSAIATFSTFYIYRVYFAQEHTGFVAAEGLIVVFILLFLVSSSSGRAKGTNRL